MFRESGSACLSERKHDRRERESARRRSVAGSAPRAVAVTLTAAALLVSVMVNSQLAGAQSARQNHAALAADGRGASEELPTDQLIIRTAGGRSPESIDLAREARGPVRVVRRLDDGSWVVKVPERASLAAIEALANRWQARGDVELAEPDAIMLPDLVPNDPSYSSQWHYAPPVPGNYGVNLPPAWDVTTGSPTITVAVVDTGRLDHADLAGRHLPGYDFITEAWRAHDGDGRDPDPLDAGNWSDGTNCTARNSNWHGGHVAGTVGAATNNSLGVAGVNWQSKILPVRVLGECGNYTSDIADGLRWAAGLAVSGVPANANPAQVINMSLGGSAKCSSTYQNAINAALGTGAIVVVSAGNDSDDAIRKQPANCTGVITVTASNKPGNLASYSNYSNWGLVEISAPGGDSGAGVLSTFNTGTTVPASDSYAYFLGTSMAAPHVSGVVALMLSINPALTNDQVLAILQATATPFPGGSSCNTSICGAGIVNAAGALGSVAALQLITPVLTDLGDADGKLDPGEQFRLSIPLKNSGNTTATAVAGTLTATADVALSVSNSAYPDIGPTGTQSNSVLFEGVYVGTCLTAPSFSLNVATDQGPFSFSFSLPTDGGSSSATYSSADVPKAIGASLVTSTLNIPAGGRITNLNAGLTLSHTYTEDLRISLASPTGTTKYLFKQRGGSGDNIGPTTFDDSASTWVGHAGAPFASTLKAEEPLANFNEEIQSGTWTLRIEDLKTSADTGTLTAWSLTSTVRTGCPPSAPSQLEATTVAQNQIDLTWTDNSGNETAFKIERRTDAGAFVEITQVAANTTAFSDTGVAPGALYTYRVRAAGAAGDSAYTNDAYGGTIDVDDYPTVAAHNGASNKLYVGHWSFFPEVTATVAVANASTGQRLATHETGNTFPFGLGINTSTGLVYASNAYDAKVTVIDGATNGVVTTIATDVFPRGLAVNSTTNRIYVAQAFSSNVAVIDGATNSVVTTVPTGAGPAGVVVDEVRNRVYVANESSSDVTVIDGATNSVVTTISAGTGPLLGVDVNPITNKAYVISQQSNQVHVIDGVTLSVTGSIATESEPVILDVDASRNKLYVSMYSANVTQEFDLGTNTLDRQFYLGEQPFGNVADAAANRLFVPYHLSGYVRVMEP